MTGLFFRVVSISLATAVCGPCCAGANDSSIWLECSRSVYINCFGGCSNFSGKSTTQVYLWEPSINKLWLYDPARHDLKDLTGNAGYQVTADRVLIRQEKTNELVVTEYIDRFSLKYYEYARTIQKEEHWDGQCKKGKPRKVATEPTI